MDSRVHISRDAFGKGSSIHPGVRRLLKKAGASPVPKVCQNAMFFVRLGLALSEKQIPQIVENTEKRKQLMELLESDSARPRQALTCRAGGGVNS